MKTLQQFLEEGKINKHVDHFIDYACDHLGIEHKPDINLIDSKEHAQEQKSFGGYYPSEKKINVNIAGRHTADILRTLAHELVHHKQNLDDRLEHDSGKTGSDIENEANAEAAVIMRNYGKSKPEIYN
jgi:Zn-dependent peptidase ImmA (M78 family)